MLAPAARAATINPQGYVISISDSVTDQVLKDLLQLKSEQRGREAGRRTEIGRATIFYRSLKVLQGPYPVQFSHRIYVCRRLLRRGRSQRICPQIVQKLLHSQGALHGIADVFGGGTRRVSTRTAVFNNSL